MEYLQNGCVNVCNLVKCRPLKDLSFDINLTNYLQPFLAGDTKNGKHVFCRPCGHT